MTRRFTYSAVLTNYNHSKYLPKALANIRNQTVKFDEVLIIDDASTDNSVEVIKAEIAAMPYARLIQNPVNRGVVASLNFGCEEAKGDYIYALAADDSYDLHTLQWCQDITENHPEVGMVSGNACVHIEATGQMRHFALPLPQDGPAIYERSALDALADKRCITFFGGANLIKRSAILEAGGQLAELKWHADWFFYLLIAIRYPFGVLPRELVTIRLAGDQYSNASNHWEKQKPVIETFIRLVHERYPNEYPFFRNHGLLPTYDLQSLPLLLLQKDLRPYLTPLLVWRLLTYKPLRAIARAGIPEPVRNIIRKWFNV